MYLSVLDALAIPEKMRDTMVASQSAESKWKLIEQHATLLHDDETSDASEWASMLIKERNYPT